MKNENPMKSFIEDNFDLDIQSYIKMSELTNFYMKVSKVKKVSNRKMSEWMTPICDENSAIIKKRIKVGNRISVCISGLIIKLDIENMYQ